MTDSPRSDDDGLVKRLEMYADWLRVWDGGPSPLALAEIEQGLRDASLSLARAGEALRRITALDPSAPIGEPPDPLYFIEQAQNIAEAALASIKKSRPND